jgi:SNF2 family DNA or RNA helicase/tetratricopeptide (TPR) repeat protein
MTNTITKSFEKLSEAYTQLSPLEQTAIQMLSIIYEPCNQTTLLNCLRKIGAKTPEGNALISYTVKAVLSALKEKGFVNEQACSEIFVEEATRLAVESGRFQAMVKAVHAEIPAMSWSTRAENPGRCIREIRIGVYSHDLAHIQRFLDLGYNQYPQSFARKKVLAMICNNPFRPEWFRQLPIGLRVSALNEIADQTLRDLTSPEKIFEQLNEYRDLSFDQGGPYIRNSLSLISIFKGHMDWALDLVKKDKGIVYADLVEGWCDFLRGNNDQAVAHFQETLKSYRKNTRQKKSYFSHIGGVFFILALMKTGQSAHAKEALECINIIEEKQYNNEYLGAYRALKAALLSQQGQADEARIAFSLLKNARPDDLFSLLFSILASYWANHRLESDQISLLKEIFSRAEKSGYLWFSLESANLLGALFSNDTNYRKRVDEIQEQTGIQPVLGIIRYEAEWERSLKALTDLAGAGAGAAGNKNGIPRESRLIWLIGFYEHYCTIHPVEQKLTKNGQWSKGRPVALSRLHSQKGLDFMSSQDHKIRATLSVVHEYWETSYAFNWQKALIAMIGHPFLFLENSPDARVELVAGNLELLVERQGDQFQIKLSQEIGEQNMLIVKEGLARYKVIEITQQHRAIAKILGSEGLKVPGEAKDRVLSAVASLSSLVMIQSAVDGSVEDVESVAADSQIYIHLLPTGSGFRLEMLVKPLSRGGPYLKPGLGGKSIIAEIDGKRVQTARNLQEEKGKALEVMSACPVLSGAEAGSMSGSWAEAEEEARSGSTLNRSNFEWYIDNLEDCLQTLLDLQQIEGIKVEWPEGEKLKVFSRQLSSDQMKLHIHKEKDWFSATGEVALDDSKVLDMRKLLELVQAAPGRFIPMEDGQFLALTSEFRKRLDELKAFSETTAKGVKFHPLASLTLRELIDGIGSLETDEAWQEQVRRIDLSLKLRVKIPSTLQASLRDYQVDGYKWLVQLANWGVGACLADDMGLGKTVQALALILERAEKGPTLIVAPTSVCMNWLDEALRFAPTLKIVQFSGKDRKKQTEGLGAFDVLVTSYALLQIESEILSKVQWQTIVLDEAQAIKNVTTKRSQAAMALCGDFKVITTGTPIENHLGELWNLFHFINPGLLGSLEKFNRRFAIPIEKYQDRESRKRLKKLIQPFILRRTKSQVLEELPSRTEITLHVEMSDQETAFYEALRQEALQRLEEMTGPAGQKHLQVLAEIMRLRRACCNTRLVNPKITLESSKLSLLAEVVEELVENRHKALVFSQFVDHLSIIREFLDKKGITYQYLDGSTPAKLRKERVNAFQAGEGDLFLISLRAGGFGLNLTAADYVIHMDPWWNPAVEDQASDRAHRIGQHRPVTIYRMVTRNTIEEKIVDLHRDKRDLASTLLDGNDMTGKMSADELVKLIREQ